MRHRWAVAFAAGAQGLSAAAIGAGTPAGTDILNQAQITFEQGGVTLTRASNVASLRVAEILDIDVLLQSPQRLVRPGDTSQPVLFTLTNTGNGSETIQLGFDSALSGDDFDPVAETPALYFDTDGSGHLSPADTPYVAGTNDPVLAADESVDILLVNAIPAIVADGERGLSELAAQSVTGTGAPGQTFSGLGDGGVDAVVGGSGAAEQSVGEYLVGSVLLSIIKSAAVTDLIGGSQPVVGASIVYSAQLLAAGTGAATNAEFRDAIPTHTSYVPGTLRLNGVLLTDARDSDSGEFNGAEVLVVFNALSPAAGAQRVEFEVTID